MLIVINALVTGDTHTHTHTHIDVTDKNNVKKLSAR